MTNEIIIDEINVAECDYILKPHYRYAKEVSCICCKEHNTKLNFCKNNPNCYYKQLQRILQKNEKLKQLAQEREQQVNKKLTERNDIVNKLLENLGISASGELKRISFYVGKLKQENEELNIIINRLLKNSGYDENITSAEDFEDIYNDMNYRQNLLQELLRAVADIKEIAEENCIAKNTIKVCRNCNNYDDCHACCNRHLNCYKYNDGNETCDDFKIDRHKEKDLILDQILAKIKEVSK